MTDTLSAFERLINIVDELRQKCPWDMEQTKESIRHLTIEETYELSEAILQNDYKEMKVELGDVLMHMLFYASMAKENGEFSLTDVLTTQAEKLIRRHPHIYGDTTVTDSGEVALKWEQIKALEKKENGKEKSTLDGVPAHLPSLIKALRMQEKAANVGFDWENPEQVWEKVKEEIAEFDAASNPKEREDEMGDLLFSIINYCRFQGINPDDALARTNRKFKHRFEYIEQKAREADAKLPNLSLAQMEQWWQDAKSR